MRPDTSYRSASVLGRDTPRDLNTNLTAKPRSLRIVTTWNLAFDQATYLHSCPNVVFKTDFQQKVWMMRTIQRAYQINEAVVAAELDNEMVLLNVETGVYFGLDELGTRVWSLLVDGIDGEEIMRQLLDEYDVERNRLDADVAEFLKSLHAKGLIAPGEG